MDNWLILAILAGFFSSFFNYGFRHILKINGDSSSFSWWFELIRMLIFLFVLPFDYRFDLNYSSLLLFIGIGFVEFFSIYFYSKMHKESELSISTIVLRLRVVWIPILAFIFIGERLAIVNYLGVLIVFIGLSFISSPKKFFYDKGISLAFVCSLITSVLFLFTKELSVYASPSVIVIGMSIPSIFLFPLLVQNWKTRAKEFYKLNLTGVLLVSLASVVTMYFQLKGLQFGTVTQVSGVFQAMSFITVLAGIFIMGEKDKLWGKIIGSIIVIFGAWLLM